MPRLQRYRLRARCTLTRAPVQIEASTQDAATLQWKHAGFAWSVRTLAEDSLAPPLPPALWDEQVRLGIPWLLPSTSERFLPQMLGFERLHAFSLRKGCYPGQEVIARTHFLGRSKRRLARLRTADPAPGASVGSDLIAGDSGAATGTLIAIDTSGSGLAVLLEAATPGMTLGASDGNNMATFVIEGDASETIGDISLNGRCEPPSDA